MSSSRARKGIYIKTAKQKKADEPDSDPDDKSTKSHKVTEVYLPETMTCAKLLLTASMTASLTCHVTDCDETYNYWEPLYHMLYGKGFQTWEYSPEYSIRSWAYIGIHYVFTLFHFGLLKAMPIFIFYFERMLLAIAYAACQTVFFKGVVLRFGNNVGRILLVFLVFSPGFFISSVAFLPSSFCMYMTCLTMGFWLQGKLNFAILAVAAGAIVAWPFSAVLGVPLAVDVLVRRKKFAFFIKWVIVALVTMLLPLVIIDSLFYGKLVIAPLNILLYNVFTDHGPDLYGTEPFSYYFLNLFLNFNFAFVLAFLSALIILLIEFAISLKYKHYSPPYFLYCISMAPMYIWMAIFFTIAHKEERFIFPIYSLICLNAAVALATIQKAWCVLKLNKYLSENFLSIGFCSVFTVLALSRCLALYFSYRAPLEVYQTLHQLPLKYDITATGPVRVCYGKEWHRFPSTFNLPEGFEPHFIESNFKGQLPAKFVAAGFEGTRATPDHFNDMNMEERGRYVDVSTCHFLVDFDTNHPTELEPRYSQQTDKWKVFYEMDFLDAYESKNKLYRAFYVPFKFWSENTFNKYQVLISKTLKLKKPKNTKSLR